MNEYDLINPPVAFTIGERSIDLRHISTMQISAIVSAYWIQLYVTQGRQLAAGLDEADRGEFLSGWLNKCPTGSALQKAIGEFVYDAPVITKLFLASCEAKLGEYEAEAILNEASEDELRSVLWFVQGGSKKNSSSQPPNSGTSIGSSAKSTASTPTQ